MIRINRSGKILVFFYIVLFAFAALCNVLTPKLTDDFSYCFSWADGSRIDAVLDIIPSMAAHAQTMNGRLIAHAAAQFFLMLPDWVFDIVNSLVFVAQVPLIVRICKCEERNNLLHAGVFGAIWICVPVFGQVNLWLDGACNYLWNVFMGLLFIQPYVDHFMNEGKYRMAIPKALFPVLAFLMGGWGESGSAAFIFIAAALTALCHFYRHKKVPPVFFIALFLAAAGYLTMYLAPAQAGKGGAMTLLGLCKGLFRCLQRLGDIWMLAAAFGLLLLLNLRAGTGKNRMLLAGVFFLGAMCANFILIFAASYPERVAVNATVLLVAADAVLMQGIFEEGDYRTVAASLLALLVVTAPARMTWGACDIFRTYGALKANENRLIASVEDGEKDITLPIVHADTKYSAVWGLRYLAEGDPDNWPNNSMADYFGADSITGVD